MVQRPKYHQHYERSIKLKGYNGKFLRIDLTNKKISVENPSEAYYRHYLGGRGFIIEKLLSELSDRIDPLGPKNKLIFALLMILASNKVFRHFQRVNG